MIKKILLLFSLFAYVSLSAQITITSADMPNAGDAVLISVANTLGTSNPTLTGSNYTWDYSSLIPTIQRYEKFDAPGTFTSPYNVLFNPLNTSYGRNNYQFKSIPVPGIQITAAYDFFKESTTQIKQIGAGYVINGAPLPFLYNQADVTYNFPLNYLNSDSCDYKYGTPIPTIGFYGQKGHRVNIADGWGTLITPFGTFQSLRIKSTIAAIDTIFSTASNFGTNIPRPLQYQFKWLAKGMKIPVLEVDATMTGGNIVVNNIQYIDSLRSGIPHVGINENTGSKFNMKVYPNPCVNELMLNYTLANTSAIKTSINDVLGKTLAVVTNEMQAAGQKEQHINIHDLQLPPGIYFINLQVNKSVHIQKIIVTP